MLDNVEKLGGSPEKLTLAEQSYRLLREDIISGLIAPEHPLRLDYLSERYNVSYSPLREALSRLQEEQLVVSLGQGRSFYVAPLSIVEMWDTIEARVLVDCQALKRSLQKGDDRWEVQVVASFHALELARTAQSKTTNENVELEKRLRQCHYNFHRSLIASCESSWLLKLSDLLYSHSERYRRPNLKDPRYSNMGRRVEEEHAELMNAALSRNESLATQILRNHYTETGKNIEKLMTLDHSEVST